MFRQFELILTAICLVLSALFMTLTVIRIRSLRLKKPRMAIWVKDAGILFSAGKTIMALSLLLLVPGLIFYLLVATLPSAVIRVFAKTLFCAVFSTWTLLEIILCFSISERLLHGSVWRRSLFFLSVLFCLAGAAYLFPLVPRSLPYPAEPGCVILDLPVRGTWLAGQAGASIVTNGHSSNRYAIDILKLGPDGRLYKGREKAVTDFYSYDEPIYAPADGRVTQVVDNLESDVVGHMDKDHPGGNIIILDIGNGKYVYFGHLKKGSPTVEEGQSVKAGALLGHVGNSGYSTHPHLHMHVQNQPRSDSEGRKTFAFRFREMRRKRLIVWRRIDNGALLRNDKFSD
jgi:Peptidase family M23